MSSFATAASLVLFLTATFFLTATTTAFRRLRRQRSREELNQLAEQFVYLRLQKLFFAGSDFEELIYALYSAQNITRFLTGVMVVMLLMQIGFLPGALIYSTLWLLVGLGISLLIGDFLPRRWSTAAPLETISFSARLCSIFLVLALPFTYPFLWWQHRATQLNQEEPPSESITQVKEKIIEMIEGAAAETHLDEDEKKMIESAVTFRNRVVREVMVPRVDIFALPTTTTVREAAKVLDGEGFSRTPVYKDSVDNIVGILMYKDLMNLFMRADENPDEKGLLDQTIESLVKDVLYAPETKKVSDLLQEFRRKQTHIAVVVDEYGGTEGIVTIEDLLEEIVGEIEDEYDDDEELFFKEPSGAWVVDGRMTIIDIEDELDLEIPQDGEYDTIGGFVFHLVGSIPQPGLVIHAEEFELEILSSTDRTVERVRITPHTESPAEESV